MRILEPRLWLVVGIGVVGGLAGCSSSAPAGGDCDAGTCDMAVQLDLSVPEDLSPPPDFTIPPDFAGMTHRQFVMYQVVLPDTRYAARRFFYDIDGNGKEENRFAAVAEAIYLSGGVPLQETVNENIAEGKVLLLLDIASWDQALTNDNSAFITSYVGRMPDGGDPSKLFTGDAPIDLDPDQDPVNRRLEAVISDGGVQTRRNPMAVLRIRFPLLEVEPVPLTLWSAHLQFQISKPDNPPLGGHGLLAGNIPPSTWALVNGAVRAEEIRDKLGPAVAEMVQKLVDKKRDIGDMGTDVIRDKLLAQFDPNGDQKITTQEVLDHPLVSLILAPDLDLFDAKGNYNPGQDKVNDCVSFGANFQAVGATFTPPSW